MEYVLMFALFMATGLIGYYVLPWVFDGYSPRMTWKRDKELRRKP